MLYDSLLIAANLNNAFVIINDHLYDRFAVNGNK
jgi:hypothetical protein